MHNAEILQLFAARSNRAIAETEQKYGRECRRLAVRIRGSDEDAEECFNDVLMWTWDTIPMQKPDSFAVYLRVIMTEARIAFAREAGVASDARRDLIIRNRNDLNAVALRCTLCKLSRKQIGVAAFSHAAD